MEVKMKYNLKKNKEEIKLQFKPKNILKLLAQ